MYLLKQSNLKKILKNMILAFGVILWLGALSPEIFIKAGTGCILDENGEELTAEEAKDFMEAYFYGDKEQECDAPVKLRYRLAILEVFE
ncbi:MAG: hypothetical protein J6D08_10405 [Lachnospiraceae bacterium]|nr:hypothetical protein [Lachnospiraceae bacterium]